MNTNAPQTEISYSAETKLFMGEFVEEQEAARAVATGEIDFSLGKAEMVTWSWQQGSSEKTAGWASLRLTRTHSLSLHRLGSTSAKTAAPWLCAWVMVVTGLNLLERWRLVVRSASKIPTLILS